MAETSIALKLTLDALGAQEETSNLVKAVEGFAAKFREVGAQMENTMRGRLIQGVLGTFQANFSRLMDETVPASIRKVESQISQITAVVGAQLGPQAGTLAGQAAREAAGPGLARELAAFADVRANLPRGATVEQQRQFITFARQAALNESNYAKHIAQVFATTPAPGKAFDAAAATGRMWGAVSTFVDASFSKEVIGSAASASAAAKLLQVARGEGGVSGHGV